MHNILLVEDDAYLRHGLCELLTREGFAVRETSGAKAADRLIASETFELAVLDISLPDGDGISLCKAWRGKGHSLPILFLTARDEEMDIVRGLDAGGDDYITKPFRMLELLSRIRALLRRADQQSYVSRGLSVDLERMLVKMDGEQVNLTGTEFRILSALIKNAGRILTRGQLLQYIWDEDGQFVDDNTLSVHVSRLREKIGPNRILTIRGVGYRWE